MTDIWQAKGTDEYWSEKPSDSDLRAVMKKYAAKSVNVELLLPVARDIMVRCLIAKHYDETPAPSEVRDALRKAKKYTDLLSMVLASAPPEVTKRLGMIAALEGGVDLAKLELGDRYAREDRFQDAGAAVEALARWSGTALEAMGDLGRGRPREGAPALCGRLLADLYTRLTGHRPTRNTPLGRPEEAQFGRFSNEFLKLIDMKLSEDARKKAIAALKAKMARDKSVIRH